MTIGIYALYWEEQDLIYIGQSQDIERRWVVHKSSMTCNSHYNYKIQETYNSYGLPRLHILEECSIKDLNKLEAIWYAQFSNTLNIMETGVQIGTGIENPNSRYSKFKILRVFVYLYKYGLSSNKISKLVGMPRGTISHVQCGDTHLWLQQEYPEQYKLMQNKAKNSDSKSRFSCNNLKLKYNDSIYVINNLMTFAKENCPNDIKYKSFYRGLQKVIAKESHSYRGYTLV